MPAIIFLNRSWSFASDDVVVVSTIDIVTRLICLFIMGIPFMIPGNFNACITNTVSIVFFALVFAAEIFAVILSIVLADASSKGGPMEVSKRKNVPSILFAAAILSLCFIPILIGNIYLSTKFDSTCPYPVFCAFLAGNVVQILILGQYFVCLMIHFRRSGSFWSEVANTHCHTDQCVMRSDVQLTTKLEAHKTLSRSVQRRLRFMSNQGRSLFPPNNVAADNNDSVEQDAIVSVANLFSDVFYDVNVVTSDIVAGLVLLRWQTCQWVGSGHRVPWSAIERDSTAISHDPTITEVGDSNTVLDGPDWLALDRLKRVSQLGISLYGRLLFFLTSRVHPRSLCSLYRHLTCTGCSTRGTESVGDVSIGCCLCAGNNCELAAMLEQGDIAINDLVAVSFENTVYQSPYFVAIDDRIQCIVIAVRGTLSLEDAIVDLLYDGVRLEEIEVNEELRTGHRPTFIGHRGMVSTARRLHQRLLSIGAIEHARSLRPNFPLIVCGHSLGAGIASFLTLLLRPLYPEVKGYALSASLGMMNSELAEFSKPFLVSIIYGFDLFARLNKVTMLDFKWRLLDALSACSVPKYHLLSRSTKLCFSRWCCKRCGCSCCSLPPTVGQDTRLFDPTMQHRLTFPAIKLSLCRFNPQSNANETGDADPADDPLTHSRLLTTGRSLLRWMDSSKPYLYGSGPHTTPSNRNDRDLSESEPHVYDMQDGVFGGLVLHLLDVDLNKNITRVSNSPAPDSPTTTDLKCLLPNECASNISTEQVTVAVWTNADQFKTLLVHPRMFSDHIPDSFLGAINRVHSLATSSSHPHHSLNPCDVLRTTIQ